MRQLRRRLVLPACLAAFAAGSSAALLLAGSARAHDDPCHERHTCPSDNHTYVWTDAKGRGWDCAEFLSATRDPRVDRTVITYAGLRYYCHAAGGAPPPSSGGTTSTGRAATTAPQTSSGGRATTATTTTAPAAQPSTSVQKPAAAPTIRVRVGRTVLLARRSKTTGCTLGANPDRRCSPGAFYTGLTTRVLCSPSFRASSLGKVSQDETVRVEREYGLAAKTYGRGLEIDHIVPLELGGSNSIANLFPLRRSPHPGYEGKDALESKLRDLVCRGRLSLRATQRAIAWNWQAVYKRVFGAAPAG